MMNTVWDFVRVNHPGYFTSEELEKHRALVEITGGEINTPEARYLLEKEYGNDPDDPQVDIDLAEIEKGILEKSIEGYIEKRKDFSTSKVKVEGDTIIFNGLEVARVVPNVDYRVHEGYPWTFTIQWLPVDTYEVYETREEVIGHLVNYYQRLERGTE